LRRNIRGNKYRQQEEKKENKTKEEVKNKRIRM
jgi:hypothetical protein